MYQVIPIISSPYELIKLGITSLRWSGGGAAALDATFVGRGGCKK